MHTDPRQGPGWVPPHCPNPKCPYHKHIDGSWPWRKRGFYMRPSDRRRVQRYQCRTCRVTFSGQTFSSTYWLKKPHLLGAIFMRVVGCMAARQIARDLQVAPETINRQLARLGRHCLLFHMDQWRYAPPRGPVVVDGFESFEYSQYHPLHHNVAVEAETGFFLYHTDSELRRKGRMTVYQKRRRRALEGRYGRASPRAIQEAMAELLRVSLARAPSALIRSDEHRAYPWAVQQLSIPARHEVTSSKKPRTSRNPLFAVNELDLLIRHSQANHKRETIAFSKRRQASAERLAIFLAWRNYVKSRREKRPGTTAAMLKGLAQRPWTIAEILARRLFPGRIALPPRWQAYYRRLVETRELAVNRRHELRYAF